MTLWSFTDCVLVTLNVNNDNDEYTPNICLFDSNICLFDSNICLFDSNICLFDSNACLTLSYVIFKVVKYILKREACLLPSYFAVNEITKLFTEDHPPAHWKLGQLLAEFVQSFRQAAQMVSICGN